MVGRHEISIDPQPGQKFPHRSRLVGLFHEQMLGAHSVRSESGGMTACRFDHPFGAGDIPIGFSTVLDWAGAMVRMASCKLDMVKSCCQCAAVDHVWSLFLRAAALNVDGPSACRLRSAVTTNPAPHAIAARAHGRLRLEVTG